ncbi:hypothetical protein [Bacillus mesophilum]|nr:hypothetical protein [Bacillus mesophilum]
MQKHDLKSYRNACRIVKQLEPYVHVALHYKEKVLYLNKHGRELIGSNKEVKKNSLIEHTLLANEAYFYFNCPIDWKTEHVMEFVPVNPSGIVFNGMKLTGKKIVADAAFHRNGYLHLIEVDNTRSMIDNKKKIDTYADLWKEIRKQSVPILYIFTTNNERKKKFQSWLQEKNLHSQVMCFNEI